MVALAKEYETAISGAVAATRRLTVTGDAVGSPSELEPVFLRDSDVARKTLNEESVVSDVFPRMHFKPESKPVVAEIDVYEALQNEFMSQILKGFEELEQFAQTRATSMYVSEILKTIIEFRSTCPQLPIIKSLNMVYDALVADNCWDSLTSEQCSQLQAVLRKINERKTINRQVTKAFLKELVNIGLNPLPYAFSMPAE